MLYDSFVGINYYYTETGESYVSEYIILSHVYWALLFCGVFGLRHDCNPVFGVLPAKEKTGKRNHPGNRQTNPAAGAAPRPGRGADPAQYAEVTAQMVSLTASMERQKRLLQEESQRKDDLITYLAHDLKTPLTSVIGYLSLLEEVPELPRQQRKNTLKSLWKNPCGWSG